jgi:hypothetical protein
VTRQQRFERMLAQVESVTGVRFALAGVRLETSHAAFDPLDIAAGLPIWHRAVIAAHILAGRGDLVAWDVVTAVAQRIT